MAIIIRNLRADEQLINGCVVPRDTSAENVSLSAHIMGKSASPYVSTCKCEEYDARDPKRYFGLSNGMAQGIAYMLYMARLSNAPVRFANMHPERVSADIVFDVSTAKLCDARHLAGRAKARAQKSRELCVKGAVPATLVIDQCTWEQNGPTQSELIAASAAISEFRQGYGSFDPYVLGANLLLDACGYAIGKEDSAASTGMIKVILARDDIMSMLK